MAVFNFTNRRAIPSEGIFLSVGVINMDEVKRFSYKCKLLGEWYLDYDETLEDASISFRFKDRASGRPSFQRFPFANFSNGVQNGYLENIHVGDEIPQCDINIIDRKGMILFKGTDWKIYDERVNALAKPSSILPVRSGDLDGLLYKVDYSSNITGPVLIVNKRLHIKSKLLQPMFSGLILVPAIQQILTYAFFVDQQDPTDPHGWFKDWLKIFPFDSEDYDPAETVQSNSISVQTWIEKVTGDYAESKGFVEKILLEEDNGITGN